MASQKKGKISLSRKRRISQREEKEEHALIQIPTITTYLDKRCSTEEVKREKDCDIKITKIDPPSFTLLSSPSKVTFTKRSPWSVANLSQRKIEQFFTDSNYKDSSTKTLEKSKCVSSKKIPLPESSNRCPSHKWIPGKSGWSLLCTFTLCVIYCLP